MNPTGQNSNSAPKSLQPSSNPLAEVSPNAIEEISSKHPLEVTDEELELMIEHNRQALAAFKQTEAEGKRPPKQPKKAAPKGLSLDDLNL